MEAGTETRADGANGAAPASAPVPEPVDLDDPRLYVNREVSWLEFNDRVLQLAEDQSLPLLERVKFCAIYEDNLDEFFMVRVADLHDQLAASLPPGGADGMTPQEQLDAVRAVTIEQRRRLERCYAEELLPALAEAGIRRVTYEDASPEERRELDELYTRRVFPALTPLVFGVGRPFPYISNLSLSLLVVLRDPSRRSRCSLASRSRRSCSAASSRSATATRSSPSRTSSPTTSSRSSQAWRSSGMRSSASPATPTTTSPTKPTTSARPSRTRSAAAASAR
jgi:hypothetical protein